MQRREGSRLTIADLRVSTERVARLTFLTQVDAVGIEVAGQAV